MPTVEVDELQLQADRKLRATVENWFKNPKAKRKLLEAQKIVDPKADIPELDEPDPIEAMRKEYDEKLAALQAQNVKDKEERERDQRIQELKSLKEKGIAQLKSERWTDDGIKAVEGIMESKGILDPLDAAAIFLRDHPPAEPIKQNGGSGPWNFVPGDMPDASTDPDEKYVDSLLKSGKNGLPDSVLMGRVQQTLNEVRHVRR